MDRLTTDILIAACIGVVLGAFVHRRAVSKERIHGGIAAVALHYLGSAAFSTALPGVLIAIFTGLGFLNAIAIGIGSTLVALVIMVAFAAVEYAPREAALARETGAWTAEKAKTSGL
jgi:hypothetical protein